MMPPASFPALAAMRPGPTKASTAMNRRARPVWRTELIPARSLGRPASHAAPVDAHWSGLPGRSLEESLEVAAPALGEQGVDDVVGEDAAEHLAVFADEDRRPSGVRKPLRDFAY